MHLGVDIGNTRTKIAVYEKDMITNVIFSDTENFHEKIIEISKTYPSIQKIILSSVGFLSSSQEDLLKTDYQLVKITHQSKFPFTNEYQTPETLGIDRMVLAAGASLRFPNENILVIDAGTAITYDFITADKKYLGGAISPGVDLRFKSLNDYTTKLPRLHANEHVSLVGKTTQHSIESGVINGTVAEIDGIINSYLNEYHTLTIILTGGDADFLSKRLKNTIFVESFFLLESLNRLYHYIQTYD